jgi:adenine phosphoribosyltransferase
MPHTHLEQHIRCIPDFPKAGILFRDITPLLRNELQATINALASLLSEDEWQTIDAIVGVESRGFIFASALAYAKNKSFLVVRKPQKLPPPVHTVSYSLEYGQDTLEMSSQFIGQRVLIVDDVLATGGTLTATCQLCEQAGNTIQQILTLINLADLNIFTWQGLTPRTLFRYGGA